jgi:hypothetical protein
MDHELTSTPHQRLRETITPRASQNPKTLASRNDVAHLRLADSADADHQPGGTDTTDSRPPAPKRRSQRCREPLAPPRSRPLYVRNHRDTEPRDGT